MSCCGQRRRYWRNSITRPNNGNENEIQAPVLQNPITLYHLADYSLVVKGAISNITYLFGGRDSYLSVDERDAPALLSTRQFAVKSSETSN